VRLKLEAGLVWYRVGETFGIPFDERLRLAFAASITPSQAFRQGGAALFPLDERGNQMA